MASKFDEYLKNSSSADLKVIKEQGKVFKDNDIKANQIDNIHESKANTYKEATGRDLDAVSGGYEAASYFYKSIDTGVKEQADTATDNTVKKDNLAKYPIEKQLPEQEQENENYR